MGRNEQKFVQEAFRENWIAPLGPNVNGFEEDLQKYCGVAHAAALSSGTASLHLALILMDVKPGDYVICQSMTFAATANPIAYLGAQPVFIDSEKETWNMCPKALEEAIISLDKEGKKAKAIIPVHLYGMPAQIEEITKVAQQYHIPIVEDAAEALGSSINEKKCGSFGELGVLSFNGNKIITTSGGGALLGNNKELIDKSRFLATQARDDAPHYEHTHIGYNYRMSNICAGIGRGQMEVLDEHIALRRTIFEEYEAYFEKWNEKGFNIQFQKEPDGYFSNRWLSCIAIDPEKNKGLSREGIRLALLEENIESRPLWKPMHLQPVFKNAKYFGAERCAEELFETGLCLPSGSNLTQEDKKRVFKALDEIFKEYV